MDDTLENRLVKHWYSKQRSFNYYLTHIVLLLFAFVFSFLSYIRRTLYQFNVLKTQQLKVPVIVVGNISVGGTGKTPLVIWLVAQLKLAGYTPGIISRGFGAKHQSEVRAVYATSLASEVGDEPVLMAQRTHCPVFVSANRVLAGLALIQAHPKCDVLISDDGLQHYQLGRSVEIAVIDSERLFGNACLLPAGPLRESVARLKSVDIMVMNGVAPTKCALKNTLSKGLATQLTTQFNMQMQAGDFVNVANKHITASANDFKDKHIKAVAGIGHPARFFQHLTELGLSFTSQAYPDHYAFKANDFDLINNDIVLMTEKDAVKCNGFTHHRLAEQLWFLPVDAKLSEPEKLMALILKKLV